MIKTYLSQAEPPFELSSQTIFQEDSPIYALSLSPDETVLAISQYSHVTLLNVQDATIVGRLTRVEGRILSLEWDPYGQLLLLARANGDVFLWTLEGGGEAEKIVISP